MWEIRQNEHGNGIGHITMYYTKMKLYKENTPRNEKYECFFDIYVKETYESVDSRNHQFYSFFLHLKIHFTSPENINKTIKKLMHKYE